MSEAVLSRPRPDLHSKHQPGIVDPEWPKGFVGPKTSLAEYSRSFAGRIDRQQHLHIITADVLAASRTELEEILRTVTRFARNEMKKRPVRKHMHSLDPPPETYRVTITVGLGATLFLTTHGDDRYDIRSSKPRFLKVMPRFLGDHPSFSPEDDACDLIFLIASDHLYVNAYLMGRIVNGDVHPLIRPRRVEEGYARPDGREPGGFEDGISNPLGSDMEPVVFVSECDDEPEWCINGTYLAYRKVQHDLKAFLAMVSREQTQLFGTDKGGTRQLDRPMSSHSSKLHPDRVGQDLLGCLDSERRFLRRPYFYLEQTGSEGVMLRGVHHMSFAHDLRKQYEWPVQMWQTNPDFPKPGTGVDRLYDSGIFRNVGGGYYFCPPAPKSNQDYIAAAIFE